MKITNSIKTMKTMKTLKTIFILAAFLGLQLNTIFASTVTGDAPSSLINSAGNTSAIVLAPVTPAEATFEETADLSSVVQSINALTPLMPLVADFNDEAPMNETRVISMAPITPKVADFEEVAPDEGKTSVKGLAPVTPAEASFEEHV